MILERFYHERLAQASYLVGCAATNEALIIDPGRDIEPYLSAAERHGLTITHVTETHIHADFISGSRELRARTGAELFLSAEGGEDWQYAYASKDNASLVHDGNRFMVGNVRVEVVHTPGHTPEHLSFMITDTAATNLPMGIFTGDFVFVGDVGRPDLLERAAKIEGTMEIGARSLYQSLRRTEALPGHLQVWPGHGAGSACGKALGAIPSTTLGYERAVNWAFQVDEEGFVAQVLAGQPEPPTYFAAMKRINRDGPTLLAASDPLVALPAEELAAMLQDGVTVIDIRPWDEFKRAHVVGSINIPIGERSFTTWAGWLVNYSKPFAFITDPIDGGELVAEARTALAAIGLDRFAGHFESNAVVATAPDTAGSVAELSVEQLAAVPDRYTVIDVRGRSEWEEGHLPGALHIPLGYLETESTKVPQDRPIVLHCLTGVRSAVGTSLLEAQGFNNVLNLLGGFAEWKERGQPVIETGESAPESSERSCAQAGTTC